MGFLITLLLGVVLLLFWLDMKISQDEFDNALREQTRMIERVLKQAKDIIRR